MNAAARDISATSDLDAETAQQLPGGRNPELAALGGIQPAAAQQVIHLRCAARQLQHLVEPARADDWPIEPIELRLTLPDAGIVAETALALTDVSAVTLIGHLNTR